MSKLIHHKFFYPIGLLVLSAVLRYGVFGFMSHTYPVPVRLVAIFVILALGAVFVLKGAANIIEETTEVLSERTKLAGGLLQSLGTAFPDMILGVIAAIISLSLRDSDYSQAIDFAIIAAATTFGSNIYNVGHAAWCLYRQNRANSRDKKLLMFPMLKSAGEVTPFAQQSVLPSLKEINVAISISIALTIITTIVAISMVAFGSVDKKDLAMPGDLYQLIRPVGVGIFILCCAVMYMFRAKHREETATEEIETEEKYFRHKRMVVIWVALLIAGVAITLTAESMVNAIELFCEISSLPFVVAGVLAGLIGCLGEMIVVHDFTIHPNGRIGDAVVGVAMDNVVTILGASIVAIMGGIFLGGSSLIVIFVVILCLNTILIGQMSTLKNGIFALEERGENKIEG